MRTLLVALLLTPALALAEPSPVPETESARFPLPTAPAMLDEARLFNTVEVDHLAADQYRVELRYASGAYATLPTMEVRGELGLTDHFQLNVGQDVTADAHQSPQLATTHLGVRYSLGALADLIPGDPAVEAELMPRAHAPARAALRLLTAKELASHLVLAANGYLEQNLDRGSSAGVDGAFGMTGGVSYALLPGILRIGGEAQLGEAQYGGPDYRLAVAMGPNAVLTRGPFAVTASALLDLARPHIGLLPMLTVGCTF
jgi:hypothetical protein